jgi:hypothetical protein
MEDFVIYFFLCKFLYEKIYERERLRKIAQIFLSQRDFATKKNGEIQSSREGSEKWNTQNSPSNKKQDFCPLTVGLGNTFKLVLLLDSIRVGGSLGGIDELISKAFSNGLDITESSFTGLYHFVENCYN